MITYEDAVRIAKNHAPPAIDLLYYEVKEIDLGWYFAPKLKKSNEPVLGYGGIVVDRRSGKIHEVGSAFDLAYWFEAFRWGIDDLCDLHVKKVTDKDEALRLLQRLDMTYVVPEEEDGVVWRIPQRYTAQQISKRLSRLPTVFKDVRLIFKLNELKKMKASKAIVFEVVPSTSDE